MKISRRQLVKNRGLGTATVGMGGLVTHTVCEVQNDPDRSARQSLES